MVKSKLWDKLVRIPPAIVGIVAIISMILVLFGVQIVWPTEAVEALDVKIEAVDTRLSARMDTIDAHHNQLDVQVTDMNQLLESLAIGECLSRTRQQVLLMRLPCERLGVRLPAR